MSSKLTQTELTITDPKRAEYLVRGFYPNAFVQVSSTREKTNEYRIESLLNDPQDVDGDCREYLSCTAFSEDQAWLYACDRLIRDGLIKIA